MEEFKPHKYQVRAFEHAKKHTSCGLFLDMGLGKTVIALTLIEWLIYQDLEIESALVIAPKKVAENTWSSECSKWSHLSHLKVVKVLGSAKQRAEALETKADIYITNRENVKWLVEYYKGNKMPFGAVVIDELSSFKNYKSQRFKALKSVIGSFGRVIGLTGTPAPNGLLDLWAQLFLLDEGTRLGRTISQYRNTFFRPGRTNGHIVYNYELLKGSSEIIMKRIDDICVSMKAEDYLELPPVIYNYVDVDFSEETQKLYNEFEKEQILSFIENDLEVTALNAAALSNKLLQFSNGAVYYDQLNEDGIKIGRDYIEVHDEKLKALERIVEDSNGQSILIAYSYQHDKERILKYFKSYDIRLLETDKDIDDWNAGKIHLLLTHPASSAYGLNLQDGGHICVWFGITWDLEKYQQFNKRLHRQGQKHSVILHHLVGKKSDDAKVIRALKNKGNLQDDVLEALKDKIERYKTAFLF